MRKIYFVVFASILFLSIFTVMFQSVSSNTQHPTTIEPPTLTNISEDTILYFQVPKDAQLTIAYEHVWAYGDATFTVYNDLGQIYTSCVFSYNETNTKKTLSFDTGGSYKMVATGVNFRYNLQFSGPSYPYKCVIAAMPHKAVFRVRRGEIIETYLPVSGKNISLHMSNDYVVPARDVTIRVYDETDDLIRTIRLDSTDLQATYEQIQPFHRTSSEQVFWRITFEGHGGGQSKTVVWANQTLFQHPTETCNLLTPHPEYYFVPCFTPRSTSLSYSLTNRTASIGSTGYVVGDDTYVNLYNSYVSNLDLKTSKHWVSWHWREYQGSTAMNDDLDPFHINWEGFNMDPFDERMQYYTVHNIQPIICLQWDTDAFVSAHPAQWTQNELEEFAEFCLAITIHCVAPDLECPPVNREAYDILGIMPLNEPNLIYNDQLNLSEAANAYIRLLQTVGLRFRTHPDNRINQIKFIVPGISPHFYGTNELEYWITQMLIQAEEYVDIISWDQYQYYLLEDLDSYTDDIERIQIIMNEVEVQRPIGLSEFGLHGGIPTIQEFYGSNYAKLYTFGALSNCINNDMKYPVYFTLIDPNDEPRQKGLLSGITTYPPFSYLQPLTPKPQYYAMQMTGWICNGSILDFSHSLSQLDVLGSKQDDLYRFGVSNRYEAASTISIPTPSGKIVNIYDVTDTGFLLINSSTSSSVLTLTIPSWSIFFVEIGGESIDPQEDLTCTGSLIWDSLKPGETVDGMFTIQNIGDNTTMLDWEIAIYPDWGAWTFTPAKGVNLTPEQGGIDVNVTITVPDQQNKQYQDYIKIINSNNPKDFSIMPIVVTTSKSHLFLVFDFLKTILQEKTVSYILHALYTHMVV